MNDNQKDSSNGVAPERVWLHTTDADCWCTYHYDLNDDPQHLTEYAKVHPPEQDGFFEARIRNQAGNIIYQVFGAQNLRYKPERLIVQQLSELQELITDALLAAHRSLDASKEATRVYHCSCGAACSADAYIDHLFAGHDAGEAVIRSQDYHDAVVIAQSLYDKHYSDVADWKPLSSLSGVLSQISNMVAPLISQHQEGTKK